MGFERPPPHLKKRDRVGGSVVMEGGGGLKKIKAKSAECVLSEAAAQLN